MFCSVWFWFKFWRLFLVVSVWCFVYLSICGSRLVWGWYNMVFGWFGFRLYLVVVDCFLEFADCLVLVLWLG